jgi:subtilisin family serine protease
MLALPRIFFPAAALFAISFGAPAQSADRAGRFELMTDADQRLGGRPLASQPLTVVLKLAADPVAVVRSRAPGKQISEQERESLADRLHIDQAALIPTIETMGGTVLETFQHAINGIKVRATADRVLSMSTLPGVVSVKQVLTHELNNAISVPFIGAPAVWGNAASGFRGEHVRVAVIDTGVDYTHANFAGPGTEAAFAAAFAGSTGPADPALFGPGAPKVKGGTDLVGDDYNASAPAGSPQLTPHPDANPLDCNGHGSHVSGTVAGFGVNPDGTTFTGPYTSATPGTHQFRIGPGVAPKADLYAVRVFGCAGSTDVVVEAIDWSVRHGMQVISMSLGADFGPEDSADAEASEHAAEAGVIVVAAAGNAGPTVYFTGSPAAGDKVLSVAAMDSNSPASFPAAKITLGTGKSIIAQNSNNASLPAGSLPIITLASDGIDASTGLPFSGCDEAKWAAANVAGKLVVTRRGVCARVDRATFGQKYGAAAVAMVNNNAAGAFPFPPFEGPIPGVTIPFLGVRGATSPANTDRADLSAGGTGSLSVAPSIPNPDFHAFASFSSGGPRNLDSHLKPDITAPGVNVVSTAMGSGNQGVAFSGTSMATPHVSGVAALALQSHPDWDPADVRLAIANTADASQVVGFLVRRGGSGLVQAFPATRTAVVARGTEESGSLSFGVAEFTTDLVRQERITVRNLGRSAQSFNATSTPRTGSAHSVSVVPASFTVQRGGSVNLRVELSVPAATSGNASGAAGVFRQVSGLISLSPTSASGNNGVALTVPYYLVPRARSLVKASLSDDFGPEKPAGAATVRNASPAVAGTADFYAWGLRGHNKKAGTAGLRAVGVQSFDLFTGASCSATGGPCLLVFAVNVFGRWTTPVLNEYDILIDADNDGKFDFVAAGLGLTSGRVAVFLFDFNTGAQLSQSFIFLASAPTNESTILLPVIAGDMGITAGKPRFTYGAQGFDGFTGKFDFLGETQTAAVSRDAARFNPFTNAVSTGAFVALAPRSTASVPLTIDPAEFRLTPARGVMVVGMDNFSGKSEANLLRIEGDEQDDD